MLHEEQMEEKHKKDQEDIRKRIEEVERQEAEEREADGERKRERGNIPGPLSKAPHHHVIPAIYIP